MIDGASARAQRLDPVQAVVGGGDEARAPAVELVGDVLGRGEDDAVGGVAADGQVLDRDAVAVHRDAVEARAAAAVEDDAVAIGAADDDVVLARSDDHLLAVGAGADAHEVAGLGGVDGGLDRRVLLGDVARRPALAAAAARRARGRARAAPAMPAACAARITWAPPWGRSGAARGTWSGKRWEARVQRSSHPAPIASARPASLSGLEPGEREGATGKDAPHAPSTMPVPSTTRSWRSTSLVVLGIGVVARMSVKTDIDFFLSGPVAARLDHRVWPSSPPTSARWRSSAWPPTAPSTASPPSTSTGSAPSRRWSSWAS